MSYYRTTCQPQQRCPVSGYEPIETFPAPIHMQVNGENVSRGASRQTSKPSLLIAMIKAVGVPFAAAGFLRLISDLLTFVGPQVLKYEKAFLSQPTISFLYFTGC